MNRVGSLIARVARAGALAEGHEAQQQLKALAPAVYKVFSNGVSTGTSFAASGAVTDVDAEIEHATGLEKKQLESSKKGIDMFHEAWLDAPFGTETNPVEVTSEFSERIVGVPDPDDDSTVWWGMIEEGQPPKQIVEGGEFFVLKRLPSSGGHH